jgi:endoglucanase
MRKITLFITLLIMGVCAQAQTNLVTNGDFESGSIDPWFGNAANLQTEGGNSFNFANVASAGNAFDVNLSQVLTIVQGETYTLTFDASSDGDRTLVAGIGQNAAPFNAAVETVNLTATSQTFTLTLEASNFGDDNSRVIFDMGADTGVVVIDNVVLTQDGSTGGGGGATGEELVINGDFEAGTIDPWFGNAANLQTEGGNSFNFANVENAGNAFDVNLSQVLTIVQGETYTMTFDASSDGDRTLVAGIGQNAAPFNAAVETVNLTTTSQTFTLTLTASNFGDTNCRVIFDMGADTGVVVIDNVSLKQNESDGGGMTAEPAVAAPTPPARNAADVFSIFSDVYTDQPNVVIGAFNAGTQDIQTRTIGSDNFLEIEFTQPDPNFLLVDWGTIENNTVMTDFHMDYWIDTSLQTGLVANPKWSNHQGDTGESSAFELTNPVSTFGQWVSVDVPISSFGGDTTRDALRQFVLTVVGADTGSRTLFLDNVYLYRAATASNNDQKIGNVTMYPNPTTDQWFLNATDGVIQSVILFDITGKQLSNAIVEGNSHKIDASNLSSGVYVARVTTDRGQQTLKLIKR